MSAGRSSKAPIDMTLSDDDGDDNDDVDSDDDDGVVFLCVVTPRSQQKRRNRDKPCVTTSNSLISKTPSLLKSECEQNNTDKEEVDVIEQGIATSKTSSGFATTPAETDDDNDNNTHEEEEDTRNNLSSPRIYLSQQKGPNGKAIQADTNVAVEGVGDETVVRSTQRVQPTNRHHHLASAVTGEEPSPAKRKRKTERNDTKEAKRVAYNSKRCNKCQGCTESRCQKCLFCLRTLGGQTCAFRPCVAFSNRHNERLQCEARKLLRSTPNSQQLLQARYEQVYGPLVANKPRTIRCGECPGCKTPRCKVCSICVAKPGSTQCFFRPCRKNFAASTLARDRLRALQTLRSRPQNQSLRQTFEKVFGAVELKKAPSSGGKACLIKRIRVGTRVYCRWPENEMYYFGLVVAANESDDTYTVHFDDDTSRKDALLWEMYTEAEYEDEFGTNTWKEETRKLFVGALCFARYSNDEYYWGKVREITGEGDDLLMMYSIDFFDGDKLDNVPRMEIFTRQEYFDRHHNLPKPGCYDMPQDYMSVIWAPGARENSGGSDAVAAVSLTDLAKERCNTCTMCKKDYCGKCLSCKANAKGTSAKKLVCLKKMCMQIPVCRKSQPIEGNGHKLNKFRFYFTEPAQLPGELARQAPANGELEGLVVVSTGGAMFRSLEEAAASAGFKTNSKSFQKMAFSFYQGILGLDMTTTGHHELLGKGFKHTWRGAATTCREAFGKIAEYRTNAIDGSSYFKIEFDESVGDHLRPGALGRGKITTWDHVDEADAWGGHLEWLREEARPERDFPKKVPFHRRYFVPRLVRQHSSADGRPKLSLVVKGFRLELEARQSSIPNSGLGLWVSVTCCRPSNQRSRFVLERGEKVDLGVYAPLLLQDFKTEHVLSLKNYIFYYECEGWSFDSKQCKESSGAVYDITCDTSGGLHAEARKNVIIYANETDGKAKAMLHPRHDPEGSVHFYLGSDTCQTILRADGTAKELKIDYGPDYEKVRVRKGYPRVSGESLKVLQQEIADEDNGIVRELKSSSAQDLLESVEFLEPVVQTWRYNGCAPGLPILQRALLVALTLQSRLKELCNVRTTDSKQDDDDLLCDGVCKTIKDKKTDQRLRILRMDLCSLFANEQQLKTAMMQQPLFVSVLTQASGQKDPGAFKSTKPGQLRSIIENI